MKKIFFLAILSLLILAGFGCSKKSRKNENSNIAANKNSLSQETPNDQPKSEEKNEKNILEENQNGQKETEVNNDGNNDTNFQPFDDREKVENQQETKNNDNTQKDNSQKQEKQILVNLIIDFATRQKTLQASLKENATVYDLLQKLQSDGKIDFSAKNYSFGVLVEEIDGVKNSKKGKKYWMFYVNGKLSEVGASGKKLNDGDKVLWKYEKQ